MRDAQEQQQLPDLTIVRIETVAVRVPLDRVYKLSLIHI